MGQSETIKLDQNLFTDVLYWSVGINYQRAAVQSVMAELMAEHFGGDTLYKCCGISMLSQSSKRYFQVAKAVLQWRWIIIDEMSMIKIQLLAGIEMCFRGGAYQL